MGSIIPNNYFDSIKEEKRKEKEFLELTYEISRILSLCPIETKVHMVGKNNWEFIIGDNKKENHGKFILQNDKSCVWFFWGYFDKMICGDNINAIVGANEFIKKYNQL